jgi:hypothetical protein
LDPSAGIPLSDIDKDPDLVRPWRSCLFLVLIHASAERGPRTPHSTQRHLQAVTDETLAAAVSDAKTPMLAFPIAKRSESELSFVSIGRVAGNDVALPSDRASKFHAYVKADETGAFVLLQDGRSSNGTFVDGEPVNRRGEGPPTKLRSGCAVRFADLSFVALDEAALIKLAHDPSASPAVTRTR